jgi:hypothetical protein
LPVEIEAVPRGGPHRDLPSKQEGSHREAECRYSWGVREAARTVTLFQFVPSLDVRQGRYSSGA